MDPEMNQENVPLLNDAQDSNMSSYFSDNNREESEYITEYGDGTESAQRAQRPQGATVICRVCDAVISLEGRNSQHVVKCHSCDEATPIRPAPPGKKYVRCPCNCLLICKASSTRIACPRNNCRRVITLAGQREPSGSAIRAPTGSCRVSCIYCNEIFLFNTLTNSLATCPHCRNYSTVGNFARRRAVLFFILAGLMAVLSVFITIITRASDYNRWALYPFWIFLYVLTVLSGYKSFTYFMIRVSHIIGPIEGL